MFFDNEQIINDANEEEQIELEIIMALYGHQENETDFFETKDYKKIIKDFMNSEQKYIYNFGLVPKTRKVIRDNANKIIIGLTKDIDRRVLFLENFDPIIYDFVAQYGDIDESKYEDVIKFLKKAARKREVTSLPIKWKIEDQRNGESKTIANYPDDDLEIIKKYPVISCGINMINQNDDLGTAVLVHEMTHALTDRNKGIVKNHLHNEVLSIYMELIAALELDETEELLKIAILDRLQSLKNNILASYQNHYNGFQLDTSDVYIDSSLYAFSLFEQYRNASNKARKSIIAEINKTLAGDRQLEDTLQVLDATEKEGSHIIRKHIKKLMK